MNYLNKMVEMALERGLWVHSPADDVFVIRTSPRGKNLTRRGDVFEMIEFLNSYPAL